MAEKRLTTYTLTVARKDSISFDRKTRRAILQVFPPGTPAMADDRKVKTDPADADTVVGNFQKAKRIRPLVFGHGKDPAKGGKAAGRLLEFIRTPEGGIDCATELTPVAAREIEDGEWYGTSARFSAWKDAEGFLHPVDVEHLSLTNDPAVLDQKEIYLLEAAHETEPWDIPVLAGDAMAPDGVLAAIRKLLGLPVAATQQEINEQLRRLFAPDNPSPEMASVEKEPQMEKKSPEAPGAAGAGGESPKQTASLDREAVKQFVQEMIAADRKVFREEFLREQRQKTAVEAAIASGKVTVGCRESAEKMAASNIEAFEAFVASAPVVAPVKRAIKDATEIPLDQIDFSTADLDDAGVRQRLHQAAMAQLESKKAATYEDAIQLLTRKAVN